MEHYTIDEAAYLLKQPAVYLQRMILYSGKAHPILKPCVYILESVSMRMAHRNANIYVKESGIEHTMKKAQVNAFDRFEYPVVMLRGLFELTFYPDHVGMTMDRESGRIQLYCEKATRSPLANTAVDRIMNNWHAMTEANTCRAKSRTRQEVGDVIILTQGGLHYLVDAPLSIPLSDIRVTGRMLMEYAASEGITLLKPQTELGSSLSANHNDPKNKPELGTLTLRREYYTPSELAEYWRNSMNIKISNSDVDHFIEAGMLKVSVRYETHHGYWWDEDDPDLIHLYNPLNPNALYREPAVKKLFIRLKEAKRFEKEHFPHPTHAALTMARQVKDGADNGAPRLDNISLLSKKDQAVRRRAFIEYSKAQDVDIYSIGYDLVKTGATASFIRRELDPNYKPGENKSTTSSKGGIFVAKCKKKNEERN